VKWRRRGGGGEGGKDGGRYRGGGEGRGVRGGGLGRGGVKTEEEMD